MQESQPKPSRFHVNGCPVETAGDVTSSRFVRELEAQGWTVETVEIDGAIVALSALDSIDPGFERAEFIAAPPPELGPQQVVDAIRAGLPKFVALAQQLGDAFSRGEWRPNLPVLQQFLDELRVCAQGLSLDEATETPGLDTLPEHLAGLIEAIEAGSWVEVSDALSYEIAPLIESWAAAVES